MNSSHPIPVVPQADVQQDRAGEEMERRVFARGAAGDAALPGQVRRRRRLDVFFRPGLQHPGRGETLNFKLFLFDPLTLPAEI